MSETKPNNLDIIAQLRAIPGLMDQIANPTPVAVVEPNFGFPAPAPVPTEPPLVAPLQVHNAEVYGTPSYTPELSTAEQIQVAVKAALAEQAKAALPAEPDAPARRPAYDTVQKMDDAIFNLQTRLADLERTTFGTAYQHESE